MRRHEILRAALILCVLLTLTQSAGAAGTSTYNVSMNTAPLIGHPAGPFTFYVAMTDGSGLSDGNNIITISNLDFGGGRALGNVATLGATSGDLASGVTLSDSSSLNLFSEAFSPGQTLRFTLSLTSSADDGPVPDGFAFYILDSVGNPLPTLSPAADFFIRIDLGPLGAPPETFGGDPSRSPTTGNPIAISAPTVTVDTLPLITLNPKAQTVIGGATVRFTAAASGLPTPSLRWQSSADGVTFTNISGAISSPLSFVALVAQNGNEYRAVFTNAVGTATTTAAKLTVNPLPGDVNGDGVVSCADMAVVKASFGKKSGQAGFDPRADVNGDGIVNVLDLSTVARQLPAGTVCK